MHRDQQLLTLGAESLARFLLNFFKRTEHQREGSAEFVADVAEERGLGTVKLGQSLRPLALLLIGASAGHTDRDLFGNPIDELAVSIVKGSARMDSRDEESARLA